MMTVVMFRFFSFPFISLRTKRWYTLSYTVTRHQSVPSKNRKEEKTTDKALPILFNNNPQVCVQHFSLAEVDTILTFVLMMMLLFAAYYAALLLVLCLRCCGSTVAAAVGCCLPVFVLVGGGEEKTMPWYLT